MAIHILTDNAKPLRDVQVIEEDITTENMFTDPLTCAAGDKVSVSISGVFDATVVVQRMLNTQIWRDVPSADNTVGFTGPTEQTYEADEACFLRAGIRLGDFTSGVATCRLGKG